MLTTSLNGYQFYNPIEAYKPFIFWEVFWYGIVWKFCEHTASPKGLLNFDFALEFFFLLISQIHFCMSFS